MDMIRITPDSAVCMIGLGKLGLPVAEVMAKIYKTHGYDPDPLIESTKGVITHHRLDQCVEDCDIVFIAVPTPHDAEYGGETPSSHLPAKDFDYTILKEALADVAKHTNENQLIVNISTVLPGTIRKIVTDLGIAHRFVYNPSLIAMGTVANDFMLPDIFVAGFENWQHNTGLIDPENENKHPFARQLIKFMQPLWNNYDEKHPDQNVGRGPHITCGTFEEAECIKIFHNTYISAKIGIANMIQDVTHKMGMADPGVVAESLSNADRIVGKRYMTPGMGDGGPCHPRDNIALSWLAEKLDLGYDLFSDIIRSREVQAKNIADELLKHNLPVHIMGKAFKPAVNLTDGSASMLVGHYVEQAGKTVIYDKPSEEPAVYLLAHDQIYSKPTYDELHPAEGSVVVDMYRKWIPKGEGVKVVWYGMRGASI